MERNNEREVLDIALLIALNLLKSGAEIGRVEDTINYICKAYGAKSINCYAIPNLIIASIDDLEGGATSEIRRNYKVDNNLFYIEAFNQLSRDICETKPSLNEVLEQVKIIKRTKNYHWIFRFIAAFMAAFGCSMFFGGTWRDAICAGIVGMSVYGLLQIDLLGKHRVLYNLLAALLGGILSVLLCTIGFGENISFVMIGGVMLMIPGISIGTSLKDIIYGDVVSGSTRLMQAIAASIAIAAGFSIWSVIFDMQIGFNRENPIWMLILGAPLAAIGYAIVFNAKPNKLIFCLIGGTITSLIYILFSEIILSNSSSVFVSTFLAVLTGSILAEVFARIIKAPAICMMLPSIIVLVPGASLFFMMCNLINYQPEFLKYLAILAEGSFGIALGIIGSQIVPVILKYFKFRKKKKR